MAYFKHYQHSDVQMYIPSVFVAYTANISEQNGRLFAYKALDGCKILKF